MYVPAIYKNENLDEVREFIRQNGFGILISAGDQKPLATHIPLELSVNAHGKEVLQGHVAKANPHWQHFKDDDTVLIIFNGPHTYVSSSWYDFEEVPTWNYIAVHVYGNLKIIEGDALYDSLNQLVKRYESNMENPIELKHLSKKTMRQIRGIVGFEIEITDIQAAYKLSQGHNNYNHQNIIRHLEGSPEWSDKAIAKAMKDQRKS